MRLSFPFGPALLVLSACCGFQQHVSNVGPGKGPFASCEEGQCTFDLSGDLESDALTQQELPRVYGCPGCADGPAFHVFVPRANAAATDHSYDPSAEAEVPAELRNAHRLLRAVKLALTQCKPSAEVELDDCAPSES